MAQRFPAHNDSLRGWMAQRFPHNDSNPSSGLAATFSPDDSGEGTRMPILLAGDAGRFRRLDILVRRTTVVFSDLTAPPTKPRIEMCTAEYSKKKHNQWQLPFFRGGKTPHPAWRPPSPLTTGEKAQDESAFQSRAPHPATLLILNHGIAAAQKHNGSKHKREKRYFFIRLR